MAGARVLLPRAAEAREVVPDSLRAMGARVDVVDAYQNVVPDDAKERAAEVFGKTNSLGSTPTTTCGFPSSRILRPKTPGSLWKYMLHAG